MNEVKDLDIFILTYKNFKEIVKNDSYKVICCKDEKIDTTLTTIYDINSQTNEETITEWNDFYSELSMVYWMYKNYNAKKYIGICQYRRYFNFLDEIPNMDDIFKNNDVIMPFPLMLISNVKQHYEKFHNIKDLNLVGEIIDEKYPTFKQSFDFILNNRFLYPCNMFIMKTEDFKKYCEFYFDIMNEFLKRQNIQTIDDLRSKIDNEWEDYCKRFSPNNEKWYQTRIGGFLAERLLTIFVHKHFKRPKHINVILTENKYMGKKINNIIG